ncbi:MAG: Divergent AAA domain protein [bacterium ADurb.Bin243]|nr:MAG: Divergent AAA domain protein [bacterium ADurb.Bin243]HOD40907.1 putative DNA binding domain-containing protein [Candidatus Wallbacteria bacterium]
MKYSESENIELKREYTPDIKKEIIAFANTDGGDLYIGISDDGKVVGVAHPEKVLQQVTHVIRDGIRPDLTMFTNCRIKSIKSKNVIKISVARGTARPYYLSEKGLKPSGVYVRHATSSNPASYEAIRKMIKETDGDRFELARSMDQELTFEAAGKEFAKRKIDFGKTQMKTLGIINADELYTNLGLLLSDQCAHTIKIACFEGTRKSEFKDRREFEGSILRQLQDSYEYINMFNKIHATYSGLDRIDRRDYPEVAIREALLNAIVHRDYSFSGSTLISIFEDRIEFVSLGGLVAGLSIDDIMNGASQARNEKLANLFYRLKLVEAYGTGIIKIIESYEESPAGPKLKATDNAFNISIPNLNFAASNRQADSDDNMNEQWKMILNSIAKKGSVTRQETEKILGIGQTRAHVLLKAMIHAGMIKAVGDGKKRRYVRK